MRELDRLLMYFVMANERRYELVHHFQTKRKYEWLRDALMNRNFAPVEAHFEDQKVEMIAARDTFTRGINKVLGLRPAIFNKFVRQYDEYLTLIEKLKLKLKLN